MLTTTSLFGFGIRHFVIQGEQGDQNGPASSKLCPRNPSVPALNCLVNNLPAFLELYYIE